MGFQLTTEQQAIVDNRGGGLLVSAAAGAGKTRVLVERLLGRVVDEGKDIHTFLVITYTRAAASELRSRIAEELAQRIADNPEDEHLRRQATLVYQAPISTVHAFCTTFLRECGYLMDLDGDFRLCDEGESAIMMDSALNAVLEERYEALEEGGDFANLVDTMSAGRDDSRLMSIVLDIYNKIQSHPHPSQWLVEQKVAFALENITDVGDTPWGALLLQDSLGQVNHWIARLEYALDLCQEDEKLTRGYAPSIGESLGGLESLAQGLTLGWDEAVRHCNIPFPRLGSVRNCAEPELQAQVKAIRATCKKRMELLAKRFEGDSIAHLADMASVYPAVRGLFELVEDFSTAYGKEKSGRNVVDFSDLEHFTVALLVGKDGQPTELAQRWSGRYTEIMVDEYQDTNEVQNAIFTALSTKGTNLFMVGDVKQSIYRFRLADPTIFLGKYRTFLPIDRAQPGENRRISLSQNFRSRPQVLEGANDFFYNTMSREFGEMDYTAEEALYPGGTFLAGGNYATELNVVDGSGDGGDKEERGLVEARFVAKRIVKLLEERFPVADGMGGMRPIRGEDMVILLRAPNSALHYYIKALEEVQVPWQADGSQDFFHTTEVSVALSLLQIIDNPRQDVPLLAVLCSPLYHFSADHLARLRSGTKGDFYSALTVAAEGGDTVCSAFLEELHQLRQSAGDKSSHQLIWYLYQRTNMLGIFGAMPDGESRQGNLHTLYEMARRFEGSGHRGLFGFLRHLTRLQETGSSLGATASALGSVNGVRIMSIHRSKGLEFPVVFLAGLYKRLNRIDMQRPMLFHPKLGVGPKVLDVERMVEYPTLARQAVAHQLEMEMMAEELRLLYVAMTRAKDKLIMVYTLGTGLKELKKMESDVERPLPAKTLASYSIPGQWILLSALSRKESAHLCRQADLSISASDHCHGPAWDIHLTTATMEENVENRCAAEEIDTESATGDFQPQFLWEYPWQSITDIPSKLTATQLKGRYIDQEVVEECAHPAQKIAFPRPRFAVEEFGLTPAQKGTALHLVMQYIDYQRTGSMAEIEGEIQRLMTQALVTPEQGNAAQVKRLLAFFQSSLGRELCQHSNLHREFKFSTLVPAKDYYPGVVQDDQVLLQGVIDCWFESAEGITVVDFKTDRVTAATVQQRSEDYRLQMEAYCNALRKMTGKEVHRVVLWYFSLNAGVELAL